MGDFSMGQRSLDMTQADSLWDLYHDTQFIKMCRDILRRRLFGDGMHFLKGFKTKKLMVLNLKMKELMDDYWMPFAREALDHILVTGLVPYILLSVEGEIVPQVPSIGTFGISYSIDPTGAVEFTGKSLNESDTKTQIHVLSGFGYDPTPRGRFTSIVSACVPNCMFMRYIHDELLASEFLKNNPVIYCESAQKEISKEEGVAYDFYADAQEMKRLPQTTFNRSAKDIMQLDHQKQAYSNALKLVRRSDHDASSAQISAERNAEGALDRVVPLPPGQKMVKVSSSSARSDFVNILKTKQDQMAAAFGLPKSMVMQAEGGVKADHHGHHQTFRNTILFWQTTLGRMMTNVHSNISSRSHDQALKKMQSRKKTASKEDLYKIKEKECVIIQFPISIYGTTNEELKSLYDEEIIDRKTYATYRLKNAGLPVDLLFREDDPLTSQEKKNQYVEQPKGDPKQSVTRFDTASQKPVTGKIQKSKIEKSGPDKGPSTGDTIASEGNTKEVETRKRAAAAKGKRKKKDNEVNEDNPVKPSSNKKRRK
jgi:hypothetical protein|tara:strand:+ start:231 stop:1847 length:1617 start_codon:yes stop_codon:yes gene_type:complete